MDLSKPHDRLRWAREMRKMTLAEAGTATGINPKTIQAHETGHRTKRGISTDYSPAYARGYRISETWLVTGVGEPLGPKSSQDIRVPVKGVLQAGIWIESFEWPSVDQYDVWVSGRPDLAREVLYAAEVRGTSMNRIYPNGTIVVLRRGIDGPTDLITGKRYHVERQMPNGLVENTLKTVKRGGDGRIWLVPESDDPEFQAPIEVTGGDGTHVSFVGRVVIAITSE